MAVTRLPMMSWPLPEELDDAALEGLRILKTDLWDEAKNTRILA